MRISSILAPLVALAAASFAPVALADDCRHTADRKAGADAAGITRVVVHSGPGTLKVEGRPGVTAVTAAGRACTSDRDLLDDITLTVRRSGTELHIDANVPEKTVLFGFYEARLDFAVTLPQNLSVNVHDGSGSLQISNVAAAKVEDGSGSMTLRSIRGVLEIVDGSGSIDVDGVGGHVTIEDGSGELTLRNVTGNVRIEDGSGDIDLAAIRGNVVIDDGSGSIVARQVKLGVTVDDDGSGSIDVEDVGGDFLVRQKGSGSVHHARVAGQVSVPRD